jgi:glycosyltransferase involved in cell wall biosynthesis
MMKDIQKPRLLIVTDSLAAGLGGVVLSQVEWFVHRGWEVRVAGRVDERSVDLPVDAADIRIPFSVRSVSQVLGAIRHIGRLYRAYRPHLVHCHGIRSAVIAALAGRRPIVHLHGSGPIPSDPPLYNMFRRLALSLVPRLAAGAVSASPGFGKGWLYQPDVSPKLASMSRLPFPSPDSPPTFLWLGRLEEQKRPDLFIRALAQVGKVKRVRGLIAGAGSLEPELRVQAEELEAPIQFLGERMEIVDLLQEAWAFALLTRFEGMPLAVEEAMWAGRAIVASRVPPLEWLIDGAGFLVDGLQDLVDALVALTDPSLAERYGQAAAERIRAILPTGTVWGTVNELYDRKLGRLSAR